MWIQIKDHDEDVQFSDDATYEVHTSGVLIVTSGTDIRLYSPAYWEEVTKRSVTDGVAGRANHLVAEPKTSTHDRVGSRLDGALLVTSHDRAWGQLQVAVARAEFQRQQHNQGSGDVVRTDHGVASLVQ